MVTHGGNIDDPSDIIGFIECKKVGVEQTVNGTFKRAFAKNDNNTFRIPYDEHFSVSFAPRNIDVRFRYDIVISHDKIITISSEGEVLCEESLLDSQRFIFTLSTDGRSDLLLDSQSLREVEYPLQNCRILEIVSVDEGFVAGRLNDCLAGPQTPEKAKQASFVALDVRKRRFDSFDKRENESQCVSALVLTEFSHWEEKSQKMIKACIDKNLFVDDQLIIKAFIAFEKQFGPDFYDKITKDSFERDVHVREIALGLVVEREGRIFCDIEDEVYKKLSLESESRLRFT